MMRREENNQGDITQRLKCKFFQIKFSSNEWRQKEVTHASGEREETHSLEISAAFSQLKIKIKMMSS